MPRVRVRASFRDDLRAQLAWLRRHRDPTWRDRLKQGLGEVRRLLARFPAAGVVLEELPAGKLRKLVLRTLPFNVLYLDDGKDVWLVRLFHHRQDH